MSAGKANKEICPIKIEKNTQHTQRGIKFYFNTLKLNQNIQKKPVLTFRNLEIPANAWEKLFDPKWRMVCTNTWICRGLWVGSASSFSLRSGLGSSCRVCSTSGAVPLARILDSSLCAVSRPGMSVGMVREKWEMVMEKRNGEKDKNMGNARTKERKTDMWMGSSSCK